MFKMFKMFKQKIAPRALTLHDYYWEHPHYGTDGRGRTIPKGKETAHPHEKLKPHYRPNGEFAFHSIVVDWPTEYKICFQDKKKFEEIRQWCFEQLKGDWFWSHDNSSFFAEFGNAGHHQNNDFYIGIKEGPDVATFKMFWK